MAVAVYFVSERRYILRIFPNSWPSGEERVAVDMILWKATKILELLLTKGPGRELLLTSSACWKNFLATLWMLGSGRFFPVSLFMNVRSV